MSAPDAAVDRHAPTHPHGAAGRLAALADLGVLHAADVHVAEALARHGTGTSDPDVLGDDPVVLAAALAVRAVRHASVLVDLATLGETVAPDEDTGLGPEDLEWPDLDGWLVALRASPLVAVGDDDPVRAPLRLLGTRVTLDRYWQQERAVAGWIRTRSTGPAPEVDEAALVAGLDRLFPDGDDPDMQRLAAATAVRRPVSVLAGGPGTGKTRTVARILALLHEQPTSDGRPLRVALAAPSGKAAARLTEALHDQLDDLGVGPDVRAELEATGAATLHRLLGYRGSSTRFRHDAGDPLPHHVVVVDETSMVSLTMMARLLDAVPPGARLLLVGDPRQLASVEAGAVLGDLVGPGADGPTTTPAGREALHRLTGHAVPSRADGPAPAGPLADGVVVLSRVHRFADGIARLAGALERADADAVVSLLDDDAAPDVSWVRTEAADVGAEAAEADLLDVAVAPAVALVEAGRGGDVAAALAAMGRVQVLCVHRRGPAGVQRWSRVVERALRDAVPGPLPWGWYPGRPVLVTANDAAIGLFNGDTGVVVDTDDGLRCAFPDPAGPRLLGPARLRHVESHHAMTVHKAQGSQFGHVVVVLPRPTSPLLTRELLYTAVTRASSQVTVVGSEEALRVAATTPIRRATGLRERLWSDA